jgi:protein TonB
MKSYLTILLFTLFAFTSKAQSDSPKKIQVGGDEIYTELKNPPTFPGGATSFYRFISKNLVYPADSRQKGLQGQVVMAFIIEKDGSLSNFKIISSPAEDMSKEALNTMSTSPKWNPGMLNGIPVRFLFKLPLNFQLNSHQSRQPN